MQLAERGLLDTAYIEAHTDGFDQALAAARTIGTSIETVADATGLSPSDIALFYDWFAGTPRVVSCYSQGINQSAQGTDKVNAIINCHLATARIGGSRLRPLSFTGQPNAMGGREVGALAATCSLPTWASRSPNAIASAASGMHPMSSAARG